MHNFKKIKKKSVIFTREQEQDINFLEIITYPLMLQKPFYRRHSWYSIMNKDLFFGLLASLTQKYLHPKISLIIGQFIKYIYIYIYIFSKKKILHHYFFQTHQIAFLILKIEFEPLGLYRDKDINAFYTVFVYKYYKMYSSSSLINTRQARYFPFL